MKRIFIVFGLLFLLGSCSDKSYSCVCIGVTQGESDLDFNASDDDEAEELCDNWEDEKEEHNPNAECEEVYHE